MHTQKYTSTICSLLVWSLIASCQSSDPHTRDTKNINTYLSSTFGTSLRSDGATYFFVSDNSCHGCAKVLMDKLMHDTNKVFVFGVRNAHEIEHVEQFRNVYVDTTGNISRLVYTNGNVGIVKTKNGAVYEILYPEPFQMGEVLGRL